LKNFWHLIEFAVAKIGLAVAAIAPVSLMLALADAVGSAIFTLVPARARIAIDNLLACGVAQDEITARQIGRQCFQSFTRMIMETVIARERITQENWTDFVTLEAGPEALAMLNNPAQGAVVASGHLGNWEVAARAVSMIRPVSVIYRPLENPHLERYLHGGRGGDNLHFISKYKASPLRFMKLLAEGNWLALMIDQHISEAGERVRVNFFGRPCWTTRSVAMMHLTTRMPLFVALAARTGPLKFKVHLQGPIQWQRSGNREQDVLGITQALTDEIEKFARRYPEQYLWAHRRWKE
jgi:Kdo2-lipid IVA lauroyltransferase/acyltransferase